MTLKKATFKYIESEVFHVQETLQEIKEIEYEILHGTNKDLDSPQPGKSSVRTITDITELKATTLVEHRLLQQMKRKYEAIMKVYNKLIPEKQELIKLYYWDRPGEFTWDGISKKLNISRRTALRWRKSYIYEVAKELGEK